MKYNKSWWDRYGFFFTILLIALLVFLWALGESAKTKGREEREQELKTLRARKAELSQIIKKDKTRKRFLDFIFHTFFFLVRLGVVCIGLGIAYTANWYYDNPDLGDYLTWLSAATLVIVAAVFLFFGVPMEIRSTLAQIKPRLYNYIYGHGQDIKEKINKAKDEVAQIDERIKEIEP